jgi:hypothetical protein
MTILISLSDGEVYEDYNYDSVDNFLEHIELTGARWHDLGYITINISQITSICEDKEI